MKIPTKEDLKPLGQEVYTDGTLVYKFYKGYHERHPENEVEALRRVKDIPRTQQIIDYDSREQVLVTELANGHLLNEKSEEFKTGILRYTPNQLRDLFDTLVKMQDKGVVFESHARNLFYGEENGFTPIDYHIPISAHIDLGALINILTLTGVPVRTSLEGYSRPVNGENRQNHPDIRKIVYSSFRDVDPKKAQEAIARLESSEQAHRNLILKILAM